MSAVWLTSGGRVSRPGAQETEEAALGSLVRAQHSLPLELGKDIGSAILTTVGRKGSLFPCIGNYTTKNKPSGLEMQGLHECWIFTMTAAFTKYGY